MTLRIVETNNYLRIHNYTEEIFNDVLKPEFSYYAYPRIQNQKTRIVVSLYKFEEVTKILLLPSGCLYNLIHLLKRDNIPFKFEKKSHRISVKPSKLSLTQIPGVEPRQEFIDNFFPKAFKYGRGICIAPTGVGKSRAIITLAYNLYLYTGKKVLCVASESSNIYTNLDDTVKEAKESLGFEIDYDPKSGEGFLLRWTRSKAANRIEKDAMPEVASIIIDEVQQVAPGQYQKILSSPLIANAFGLTGTLLRNDSGEPFIKALVGPVLYEMTREHAENKGYIQIPQIVFHEIDHPEFVAIPSSGEYTNYSLVKGFDTIIPDIQKRFTLPDDSTDTLAMSNELLHHIVHQNPNRHKIITNHILATVNAGGTAIVLFDKVITGHGKALYDSIREYLDKEEVSLLHGDSKKDERSIIFQDFQSGKIKVFITTLGYRSINLPNATDVFVVGGKKVSESLIQAAGRLFRPTPDHIQKNKSHVHIYIDKPHAMLVSKGRTSLRAFADAGFDIIDESEWEKQLTEHSYATT